MASKAEPPSASIAHRRSIGYRTMQTANATAPTTRMSQYVMVSSSECPRAFSHSHHADNVGSLQADEILVGLERVPTRTKRVGGEGMKTHRAALGWGERVPGVWGGRGPTSPPGGL